MSLAQRRKEGEFHFSVEQHAPSLPGTEVEINVFFPHDGDGLPLLRRVLYFDEQSAEHIQNFCTTFAYDEHYRKICLAGTAHWCRVARLYELNAGIMREKGDISSPSLEKKAEELFHILRRDLADIEDHPLYQQEMVRISRHEETALHKVLGLLARIPQLTVASACQGSSSLQTTNLQLFLPSCHEPNAFIHFTSLPASFLHYLQSGPLGKQHLALFEPNLIRSQLVDHNRTFICLFTSATFSYLKKHRFPHPPAPA